MRRRASRYECRCHQSIQHSSRIMPWTVRGKNSLILRSSATHFGTAGVWRCRIHRHTIRPRGTHDEHHCRCAKPQLNRASNNQCDATSRPWHPDARGNCLAFFVKTRMCGSPAELASRRAGFTPESRRCDCRLRLLTWARPGRRPDYSITSLARASSLSVNG
jgi:hypothetical protein